MISGSHAALVLDTARKNGLKIAIAESCTGGMIAVALTDIAGSSDVFDRGFVTYSNEAKQQMLGVSAQTLLDHGAVSAETAAEMASGALVNSNADIAVSVTGVAGPGGGSEEKPVGLVWFGLGNSDAQVSAEKIEFALEGRAAIREAATLHALKLLMRLVEAR